MKLVGATVISRLSSSFSQDKDDADLDIQNEVVPGSESEFPMSERQQGSGTLQRAPTFQATSRYERMFMAYILTMVHEQCNAHSIAFC
jgi:hypothetical protein